jgi:hypothetical protein
VTRAGLPPVSRWLGAASLALALAGCGADSASTPKGATVVDLPGAKAPIDFDDIVYSSRLDRVLVPARESGLYTIDPNTGTATRLDARSADSVDEGGGRIYELDRGASAVRIANQAGHVISSFQVDGGDYVRYTPSGDVWVTKPGNGRIEVFALEPAPHRVASIDVPDGPEALDFSRRRGQAYTHAGNDIAVIDIEKRRVVATWSTGCDGTHGFPRVDEHRAVLLASCAEDGEVVLLDLDDGHEIDRYSVGGGESLPGHSARSGHFYARSDPGTKLATLAASRNGLSATAEVEVPEVGHCLTGDEVGHYWTCDADHGRILGFDDH